MMRETSQGRPEPVKVVPCELTDGERLIAVHEFLRHVGEITESVVGGGYEGLVAYMLGRLH